MQTFVSCLLLRTELSYTVSKKRERKSGNLRIIQDEKNFLFFKQKRMPVDARKQFENDTFVNEKNFGFQN